jgi:hypothetical protein
MDHARPPRVFVSYSHDTVEHQERVLTFADRLRADGVDAEIDQYNVAPPKGWPLWCERHRGRRYRADGLHRDLSPPGQR